MKMELPKEIKRARELGDLRENAEYHAAKERQTYVQRGSRCFRSACRTCPTHQSRQAATVRRPSARPCTCRENGGPTTIYELVMPEDADVEKG
jgi:transcription elongation factor GreA